MIEEDVYIETVKDYFSFLPLEFGMTHITEKIRGNVFYDVQFHDPSKAISISYENVEDYLKQSVV